MSRKLTLADIADVRAYERERVDFRRHIIELKARRRVMVGHFVTFLFENRDTIRFQVQEVARAGRIHTDEGIRTELAVYNPLIPEPGQLRATMFIELTSPAALREWLPRLVDIERAITLTTAAGRVLRPGSESEPTGEETTSCVHYLSWDLAPGEVEAAAAGLTLSLSHPGYTASTDLVAETMAEVMADLRP